jgi:hypothetical protein
MKKHGMAGTVEYQAWKSMKGRCYRPNYPNYRRYGGRGIKVCDEWSNSFTAFIKHIGMRPSINHSVDRINPDGDYEPGNVRWADAHMQSRNTSELREHSKTRGVRFLSGRYFAYIHVNSKQISLGGFDNFLDACCARKSAEIKLWRGA